MTSPFEWFGFENPSLLLGFSMLQVLLDHDEGGGGATNGGAEKLHGIPTVGLRPKVWTRDQK